MESKKQKVKYLFYNFDGTSALVPTNYTLKIENPAKIIFTYYSGFPLDNAIINQGIYLSSVLDTNNGTAIYPSQLILDNNINEIDITTYQIRVGFGTLNVICKYYVNE